MLSFLPRLLLATVLALASGPAWSAYRIKDIADFEGVRDNLLVGYGLVVGLNGSGDSLRNSPFTKQSLEAMLERMGVNIRDNNAKTDNIAAVMVTAALPGFSRQGTRIDVTVGAIGDAKSLQGGTLLVTPLMGADGEVYAVAQGSIAIGGFKAQGAATSIVRGVPTSGKIANGAIVEREVGFELASMPSVRIALRNPDVTTARRVAWAINRHLGLGAARLSDPATVTVVVPEKYKDNVVELIADIEQLQVEPDQTARVVIDENNGIIVIGNEVRISTVAVAQGNLTVKITETPQVSQPGPFAPGPGVVPGIPGAQGTGASTGNVPVPRLDAQGRPVLDAGGNPVFDLVPQAIPGTGTPNIQPTPGQIGGGAQTVVVPRTDVQVDDQSDRRLGVLKSGVTLGELVNGLNSLGIGPRDMISILQAVKAAGALQADIVTR
ncbi:flagellar basal body P-ring protein FlgI [Desertibaculum subflavum]|uniref:flagellar basal body P-ring protein FlgI n=1 Tax=Desertibaculum subflavum TaxID=2268458 RepID=UPI0034D303E7